MRDPERTKEAILCAAARLIVEKGLSSMTLEEVAAAAAVSKGGLLHHFSNKQDLITGITQHMLLELEAEIEDQRQRDPVHPGAFSRALLRTNLDFDADSANTCLALMSEARTSPASLELIKSMAAQWQAKIENDGLDPVVASIVRYAGEGLMFNVMWGVPPPANFQDIARRLLELAGGSDQPVVRLAPKE